MELVCWVIDAAMWRMDRVGWVMMMAIGMGWDGVCAFGGSEVLGWDGMGWVGVRREGG